MNGTEMMQEEPDHYVAEKEKVRNIIGAIGGKTDAARDKVINAIFIVLVSLFFLFDLFRHLMGIHLENFPPVLSLEMPVLLVSVKIIWMIHRQARVDHFQFWVLNSIEFQMNAMSGRLRKMEQRLQELSGEAGEAGKAGGESA
ncbi:MAG: hypothetical protein ACQETZ_02940 [Candidatus Fermentibacterota bacterium]